jgi:hypothetical protein
MALFIQKDYQGVGLMGNVDAGQAQADLVKIADQDSDLGWPPTTSLNRIQVTYAGATDHPPQQRLTDLVNLPAGLDIVIVAAGSSFVLYDGTMITAIGAITLPAWSTANPSADCLLIYDISENGGNLYCGYRPGTSDADLRIRTEHNLYNQLEHAYRTVSGLTLPFPDSEKYAIDAENELREMICNDLFEAPWLRDRENISVTACPGNAKDPCKFSICCIIASVASGSAVSPEVNALRAVRDTFVRKTEVGFAFFNKLLYDYYGFSPQICTKMAGRPELAPMVLQGFVHPLIVALRLLQGYAFDGLTDERLGRLLAGHHPDRGSAAAALAAVKQARAFSEGSVPEGDELADGIARLLREKAWPSAHVRWGLIEPVRIYGEALQAYAEGARASDIGRLLRRAFTAWAAEMPLDHVWAGLTAKQARDELAIYESRLLRSAPAKKRFRRRLADRFGDITAVQAALAGAPAVSGSAA